MKSEIACNALILEELEAVSGGLKRFRDIKYIGPHRILKTKKTNR